jgi:hypothetical protein
MTDIATIDNNDGLAFPALSAPATPARRALDLKHWAQEFADVYRVSEALAKTPFVPKEMTGKTADVAAAIMKGRELGLDPFDALGSVYVVHGRVGFYAEFMRRRIIEAGHKLRIVESTDNRCVIEGRRKGDSDDDKVRVTYTVEQAKRNGVNLGAYPADKLVARATSRICRQHFPDVLAGSLIAEDLIDGLIPADDTAAPPPAPTAAPERPAVQRKRPTKKAEAAATQPPTVARKAEQRDDELAELLGDDEPDEAPAPPEPVAEEPPAQDDPEPIEAEVVDENPDGITPQQLKKMSAMLNECGFEDRETRHAFVQTAINRTIESAKDLTKAEASKVIDILADSKPID